MLINETWAKTNMARTHERARRRERPRMGVSFGHWKRTNLIAGLTRRGVIAPFVLPGPINRFAFETYVERVRVPKLWACDMVIMDNLSSHKAPSVKAMTRPPAQPCASFRPAAPTSFCGMTLSRLQAKLSRAAKRTVDRLWVIIGDIVDTFAPTECKNYFAAAGYNQN